MPRSPRAALEVRPDQFAKCLRRPAPLDEKARSAISPGAGAYASTRTYCCWVSKGCGEVGAIGSPPAIINAVIDALKDYGVRHLDMPATARKSGRSFRPANPRWPRNRSSTMYDFAYEKPATVADAVKALAADAEAKLLAGGMTFIPVLKQRLNKPSKVIDLAKTGMVGITSQRQHDHHQAMTTHGAIAANADIKAKIAGLRKWPAGSATNRCAIAARWAAAWRTTIRPPAIPPPRWRWERRSRPTSAASRPTSSSRACSPRRWRPTRSSPRSASRSREVGLREVPQPRLALRHGGRVRRQVGGRRACGGHRRRPGRRVPPRRDGEGAGRNFSPDAIAGIVTRRRLNSDIHASADIARI